MARALSPSQVSLPSIQEMFPEHLLGLPERSALTGQRSPRNVQRRHSPLTCTPPQPPEFLRTEHQLSSSPVLLRSPSSPAYSQYSPPLAASHLPYTPSSPRTVPLDQHPANREDDRRHVCSTCGKAFNRPSSLAIHYNTHTGEKPFECPFPGCGRKFNVNSNMRRHLRNHTSPSARSSNHTPYTYPLTTCPRNYSFNTSSSSITSSRSPSSSVASSPRAARRPHLSDSEDDSDLQRDSGLYWDAESDVEDTNSQMRYLRLRSKSSPGAPLSPESLRGHSPESVSALLGLQRSRSSSCSQPGCQCTMPAALHPSESQRLLRK